MPIIGHRTAVDIYKAVADAGFLHNSLRRIGCEPLMLASDSAPSKVIVEFSSPNIAKPFHAGHLRSTLVGRFVSDILRAAGHNVITMNYLGDWGTQFGILARGFVEFGVPEKIKQSTGCIAHFYDVYVQANKKAEVDSGFLTESKELFASMERGDESAMRFWRLASSASRRELETFYRRLGVSFDVWDSESLYADQCQRLLRSWDQDSKLVHSQGAKGVTDGNSFVLLAKEDGSSLYLTRDIAAALDRQERFNPDLIIYVVDAAQTEHFKDFKLALGCLGYPELAQKIVHLPFGRIKGMSSRKGNTVLFEELLDAGVSKSLNLIKTSPTTKITPDDYESVAESLALSALVTNDLQYRRTKKYSFDWDVTLHMKGNTGVNLQYSHVRLTNLIAAAQQHFGIANEMELLDSYAGLAEDIESLSKLLEHCLKFENALQRSYHQLEPSYLVRYLYMLSHYIGSAFRVARVVGEERQVALARLLYFVIAKRVLHQGLVLLRITPLSKM